ncbi:FAD-dependent monooxygenase [Streptomyces caniscabiei]|uniref:FAD-dependent monooxygenase n=1 Tax=Streptomyces caniscabiei TaxID=2746961 RepID=A0ABU4N599_9ACTN|nr:FAD-dependent monooxygenase [Streptomyces caniscabiei]MBE4739804.1 FAD-dependent monooxygenase [Streptomyces caniscabiei]MBE4762700.1 FAD-dependent monooxygenase [Streptomyces caniscabiei]MBE4775951.1 FAD-dependent monooxygenase [Streptomyces caniscabiei]MBE4782516.1 FAD-dependent monooxygenase [Streptomyces caniscabiei]MBE4791819.1 FAD-dependent monooxygenase [Streptomyces caniscabiei]
MSSRAERRTPHPRVAVVGGGIGGLATAAFLHRAGIEATVYEQAPALTDVKAGLVVSPNAVRLLRGLGRLDRFRERAVPLEVGWEFRRWADGRVLFSQNLGEECVRRFGEQSYVAHRADLLAAVRAAVPEGALRLGTRLAGLRRLDGAVELTFTDGTREVADVVVGADGVHTTVGQYVTDTGSPRFSGICAWRCLVPAERAPEFARHPVQTLWLGPDRHLVHYPISGGAQINIVAFGPAYDWTTESWSAEGRIEDLRAEFAGWSEDLRALLAAAERTGRWALLDRDPLPRWTKGPVALLGDAAHPMFPFFAQGAAQAMEDAAVLAGCLAGRPEDPTAALSHYEDIRRPRATRVQQLSRGRADSNHLPDDPAQRARDASFSTADAFAHNGWIYGHDAELTVREAMATG